MLWYYKKLSIELYYLFLIRKNKSRFRSFKNILNKCFHSLFENKVFIFNMLFYLFLKFIHSINQRIMLTIYQSLHIFKKCFRLLSWGSYSFSMLVSKISFSFIKLLIWLFFHVVVIWLVIITNPNITVLFFQRIVLGKILILFVKLFELFTKTFESWYIIFTRCTFRFHYLWFLKWFKSWSS